MITKISLFYLLLGVISLSFFSCEKNKNLYNPNNTPERLTDLPIPDNFEWSTTRNVICSFSSPVETTVSVFLDKDCSENQLLATLPVSTSIVNLNLEIPNASETIYVQYPGKTQKEIMEVALPLKTKSDNNVVIKLPENTESDGIPNFLYIYSPAKNTYGTLLFEDMWPEKGDYDLNDFVAYYHTFGVIALSYNTETMGKDYITIDVQFRAIGGLQPYRLCLQLDAFNASYIDDIKIKSSDELIQAELLNPGDDSPAIFTFAGSEKLKGQKGGKYYNTESEYLTQENELITVSITLYTQTGHRPDEQLTNAEKKLRLIKSAAINATVSQPTTHNFFLQNTITNKEIHLRGYNPTKLYKDYEIDSAGKMKEGIPYCSTDNFVWGLKVPAPISHSAEEVDITKAYKKFTNWILSNSISDADWYKYPVNDQVITLKP